MAKTCESAWGNTCIKKRAPIAFQNKTIRRKNVYKIAIGEIEKRD